jgi:hypothetical protein
MKRVGQVPRSELKEPVLRINARREVISRRRDRPAKRCKLNRWFIGVAMQAWRRGLRLPLPRLVGYERVEVKQPPKLPPKMGRAYRTPFQACFA